MTTTQAIVSLLSNGVSQITIGKPDDLPGKIFAKAIHGIPTGERGNQIICDHQAVDENIDNCLTQLAEQVKKAVGLTVEPATNLDKRN